MTLTTEQLRARAESLGLDFFIERRSGFWVKEWFDNGCTSATAEEVMMWSMLANQEAQPVAWTVGGFATHDRKWAERRSEEDNLLLEPLYRHPVITGIDENHYDPELEPGLYVAEIMTKGGAAVINGYYAAPPAPAVRDGWKLVPAEPTEEMLRAAYRESGVYSAKAYREMLAAAPEGGNDHDTRR